MHCFLDTSKGCITNMIKLMMMVVGRVVLDEVDDESGAMNQNIRRLELGNTSASNHVRRKQPALEKSCTETYG